MALYRFLFAPVLLVVAVLAGPREKPAPAPVPPPAVEASRQTAVSAPAVRPGPVPTRGRRADVPRLRAVR